MTIAMKKEVRVRIGPSPTGDPHVGTAYIALFNYAFAKKEGGKFILRIEDTDQSRSSKKSELDIMDSLKWLGLNWDEGPDIGGKYGPYRQSERLSIHQEHVKILLKNGHAYQCTCTTERLVELRKRQQALKQPTGYDGLCREKSADKIAAEIKAGSQYVVRLKTPKSGATVFNDKLRGDIRIDHTEVDDQILQKSDGFPTYHLANVVDDHLMGISHVIRGEEWISSTPKHVLLYDAFGWEKPEFIHLPLLRNADKSKVSKRKNPVSINYFKGAGYLPEALRNFLGLMAFSMPDESEMFSLDQFLESFSIDRISLGGPVFDLKKLLWLNGRYLREKHDNVDFVNYLKSQLFSDQYLSQIVPLIKERVEKSEDFITYADFFFRGSVAIEPDFYLIKNMETKACHRTYTDLVEKFDALSNFEVEDIENVLRTFCKEEKIKAKDLFMPVRLIVTGKKASPPLFQTMAVLGKERCRFRFREAILRLKSIIK